MIVMYGNKKITLRFLQGYFLYSVYAFFECANRVFFEAADLRLRNAYFV